MTENKIGAQLKEKRKILRLTLEQVAKYVGVNDSTVSRWETGEIENMCRDKIIKLAEVLKISPLFIIGMEYNDQSATENYEETKLIMGYRKINTEGKKLVLGMIEQFSNFAAAL